MALRVGIVGLPNSGKTTLFNALTRAGARVTAYSEVTQKPNLGMAVIADDRLERLAEVVGSKKVTPGAIRVVDVPGRAEIPGELRQADALLAVLDGFSEDADPQCHGRLRREAGSCLARVALDVEHAREHEDHDRVLGLELDRRAPARRLEGTVECLRAGRRDERAQDLAAVESDLDPYEVVSHSQPPP